jgi:hypothetical protein
MVVMVSLVMLNQNGSRPFETASVVDGRLVRMGWWSIS